MEKIIHLLLAGAIYSFFVLHVDPNMNNCCFCLGWVSIILSLIYLGK